MLECWWRERIPRSKIKRILGLKKRSCDRVETAKGYADLDESFALLGAWGKRGVTPILISKELKDVLIGVLTLEALGLTVDPTTGELKEQEYYCCDSQILPSSFKAHDCAAEKIIRVVKLFIHIAK